MLVEFGDVYIVCYVCSGLIDCVVVFCFCLFVGAVCILLFVVDFVVVVFCCLIVIWIGGLGRLVVVYSLLLLDGTVAFVGVG